MGHIAERHEANWHGDWDRRHAHFFNNRFFVFIDGFWCGLDDGFYPWDYLPYYAADYTRTITMQTVSRPITPKPLITAYQRLISRSKLPRRSLLSWAITTVQSMAFSDRRPVTRWRIIKSPNS
jgi:hypothetical protein